RDGHVTGVQTCALPISSDENPASRIREEATGDNPRGAAGGGMAIRPTNGERAVTAGPVHGCVDDAAARRNGIGELDDRSARVGFQQAYASLSPLSRARRSPFAQRGAAP